MIHVEQKNILKKNGVRNLAKSTNEISIGIKASNDASKKNSDVKEIRLPIKKQSKHRLLLVLLRFRLVFYGF